MDDVNNRLAYRRKELKLTLEEVGDMVGVGKSTVRKWETGDIANMGRDKIALLAKALKVSPLYIMGLEDDPNFTPQVKNDLVSLPIVGKVSCGAGVLALDEIEGFEPTPKSWLNGGEYFYTRTQGDSMINARIHDGDLVLIRKQSDVNDGEIAAVVVDDRILLKRVYKRNGSIILQSENNLYPPQIYNSNNANNCFIVGKLKKVVISY
ncbi:MULTISPECIES: LexA family protein [Pelosinus]|uniref:Peptidase S24/S26A/S26B, conserved region n=1 Tax=Pelosinus fermentans B4 TaxID=1149862 RepID=I8RMC5_9FIRM|nr:MULTISPECIES: S24 family peptidase [Pelosinus]EIW19965.1 Peptidase S24/S26A/S26B, conserved region [Pelosinus fermentans B4]EIW21178.1 phage repressor like transcriptional regulator, XRE family [Pelosinus fermentans A11]